MKNTAILILIFMNITVSAQPKKPDPFAHTFSIVARDSVTGDMAVAVQSHWFSVGTVVSWAEAGVGAIATQSFVNVSFGPRGLELLKQGKSPKEVLQQLLDNDEGREVRQLAIIDKYGNVATHTGAKCIDYAGHTNGQNFSVQANMMLNDKVVPAMKAAWLSNSTLALPERMVAVLEAAQNVGGDIRGKQSAVLIVVKGTKSDEPWNDRLVDLQVADHASPIAELSRLLKVHRAYEYMNAGDLFVEKGQMDKAMESYNSAMKMFPDNLEMKYWTAITLANEGDIDKALLMLKPIFQQDPNWKILTERLPKVGLLTVSETNLKSILKL